MSFEAVWGFDPHKVIQAVGLPPSEIETANSPIAQRSSELRAYRLICTRRFMSSAECIDCDAVGRKFPSRSPPMYSPRRPFRYDGRPSSSQARSRSKLALYNGR